MEIETGLGCRRQRNPNTVIEMVLMFPWDEFLHTVNVGRSSQYLYVAPSTKVQPCKPILESVQACQGICSSFVKSGAFPNVSE